MIGICKRCLCSPTWSCDCSCHTVTDRSEQTVNTKAHIAFLLDLANENPKRLIVWCDSGLDCDQSVTFSDPVCESCMDYLVAEQERSRANAH